MDQLPPEQIAMLLPALRETISELQDALNASHPTRLLHIHAPFEPYITSLLLRSVLRDSQTAFLDCIVHNSPRLIYDAVLNSLAHWQPSFNSSFSGALNWDGQLEGFDVDDQAASNRRVWRDTQNTPQDSSARGVLAGHANDSLATFLEALKSLFSIDQRPKFLVFEHADRLLHMTHGATSSSNAIEAGIHDGAFLAALTRIRELTGHTVVPIFVSERDHRSYQPPMGRALEPTPTQVVSVPRLQDRDYVSLLCHFFQPSETSELDEEAQKKLFRHFARVVQSTFMQHFSSADALHELARLCSGNLWLKAQEIVVTSRELDLGKLTSSLKPLLNEEQEKLGGLVSGQVLSNGASDQGSAPSDLADIFSTPSKNDRSQRRDNKKKSKPAISTVLRLSLSSSFLLIAAYLASYNPASKDVRMLAVEEEERLGKGSPTKRRKATPRKTPMANRIRKGDPQRLLGPKAFPLERLLAIYDCIRPEEMVGDTDSAIHSQLATLLSQRLISRTTSRAGAEPNFDGLHGVKLKVNVTWEVVERLGHKVDFKVADRMWDFEQ